VRLGRRALLLAALVSPGCALFNPDWPEASRAAIAASFEPYHEQRIAGEDAESFLRRRTATLIGGVETLSVRANGGRLGADTTFGTDDPVPISTRSVSGVQGAAAAVSQDGYFLTAAHDLAAGPVHLLIEAGGEVRSAPARVVWSDGPFDVALLHAELRPEACFTLVPDRKLAAGETLLTFGHLFGGAAGEVEIDVDLPAEGLYVALQLPHDTPIRRGFSGAPAVTLDGELLGVQTSSGMDTIFKRRSWLARVRPERLQELIEADRRGS
jgi:S1-C subfamily serine protease